MSEADVALGEQGPQEPNWETKIVRVNEAFARLGVNYAFGGAIALNYHREPRSTLDIDINIFLPPGSQDGVIEAMGSLFDMTEEQKQKIHEDLSKSGQTRSLWGNTYIDLFFSNTEFHDSMAQRVQHQPFSDTQIPVLSIEDLLVCKTLYDRPKDWIDIDAVSKTRREELDTEYVKHWVGQFLDSDDPRVIKLNQTLEAAQQK